MKIRKGHMDWQRFLCGISAGDYVFQDEAYEVYAAGFYPFPTEEAKWGYWSKHALMNRFIPPALPMYLELFEIVKDKEYFVLTTNVDHQFWKAGFDSDRIFATQ